VTSKNPETQSSIVIPDSRQAWVDLLGSVNGVERFNNARRAQAYEPLNLSDVALRGLNLTGVNLTNCIMHNCDFEETLLHDAVLIFTEFNHSQCYGTQFFQADATEGSFLNCMMDQAQFIGATLAETNFSHADLNQASFQDAQAVDANFTGATLNDTNFTDANLCGCNFTDALMEFSILEGVQTNDRTRWSTHMPEGF
jgi:uncharacterized protein YjbI with pentapeptide repeats